MATFKGLYRNFELGVQYVQDMDIPKTCPRCYVRTTFDGENLPNAARLADVYGDAYECCLVFLLDGYYQGEVVKISLKNIMEQTSRPRIQCNRTCQKEQEHPVKTMYISDNETVRICLFPGQTKELVASLKFVVSGYKVEMKVVGCASKKEKIKIMR